MSYLTWRLKAIRNSFSIHSLLEDLKYFPSNFSFKLRRGINRWEFWNPNQSIATHALKSLWGIRHPQGYPAMLINEELHAIFSENEENNYFKQWKEIIHEIRFAFFYYLFIKDETFSFMLDSPEERDFCRQWARKKYWYVADFLTEEFFLQMYPDSFFNYESKMITIPFEKNMTEIAIKTVNKTTGEEVDIPFEVRYPPYEISKQFRERFEKGLSLFKEYFLCLWD